jgi:hypothetical protein
LFLSFFGIVFFISFICKQTVVGIGLIINGRYNIKQEGQVWKADRINNFTVIAIFLITIINVFISAFGVVDSRPNVEPLKVIEQFDVENITIENVTMEDA